MKREAPAHSAWLATFLITISVRFLPAACRERFHDEWMAELQEMACQDIALVPPALRILLCAPSVARALQSQGQNDGPQETLLERFTTATSKATVQHLILGSLLRRLREVCGISIEQSADAIRCSHAKIGQMERGQVRFKERDVSDLLMLYGVTDPPERAALLISSGKSTRPDGGTPTQRACRSGMSPTRDWRPQPPFFASTRSRSSPGCCRPRNTPMP